MSKTNAARMLDSAGIHYELREYQVDENDLSAPHVAEAVGMPPEQVFKTLVARGDRTGVLMACIRPIPSSISRRWPPPAGTRKSSWWR
jgi:Cys-tRNA(Pro)/Cys-tRNA(Cys) deacylase